MAQTSQPGFLSSWVASFGSFDDAHGWAVNLFAVVALAAIGGLLISGRRRAVLGGIGALVVLCVADWVLVEDLGFFGGLGTDPNSMVPMALLFVAGYLATFRVPDAADVPTAAVDEAAWTPTPGPRSRSALGRGMGTTPDPCVRDALGRCRRGSGRRGGRRRSHGDGGGQPEHRPDPHSRQ